MFASLYNRFRQYPPLLQWVLVALGVVGGVMAWQEFAWKPAVTMNARADEFAALAARAESSRQRLAGQRLQEAILALGKKEPLGVGEVDTTAALSQAINRILTEYAVEGRDVKEQTPVGFGTNEMRSLTAGGMRGWRGQTEVRFEAAQDVAFQVIAALESDPAVETVSNVRMARSPSGRANGVVVQMTVEAWYLARPGGAAGARGRS